MADDWIKARKKLTKDPRVLRVCRTLNVPRTQILGCLWEMWAYADDHADADGFVMGMLSEELDSLVGLAGFTRALPVEWMKVEAGGLRFPDYETHNGSTAKRRACEARRKSDVRKMSATDADKKRAPLLSSVSVVDVQQEKTNELQRAGANFRSRFLDRFPPNKRAWSREAEEYWLWLDEPQRCAAEKRLAAELEHRAKSPERFKFLKEPENWLKAYGPDFKFTPGEFDDGARQITGNAGRTFEARAAQGDKFAKLDGRA